MTHESFFEPFSSLCVCMCAHIYIYYKHVWSFPVLIFTFLLIIPFCLALSKRNRKMIGLFAFSSFSNYLITFSSLPPPFSSFLFFFGGESFVSNCCPSLILLAFCEMGYFCEVFHFFFLFIFFHFISLVLP